MFTFKIGTPGNDLISGGNGYNFLDGGAGNDIISGGDSVDWIFGGSGRNIMDGGGGKNFFFLAQNSENKVFLHVGDQVFVQGGTHHGQETLVLPFSSPTLHGEVDLFGLAGTNYTLDLRSALAWGPATFSFHDNVVDVSLHTPATSVDPATDIDVRVVGIDPGHVLIA